MLKIDEIFLIRNKNDHAYYHRRSQGEVKGAMAPKFLENIVILCFERLFSK